MDRGVGCFCQGLPLVSRVCPGCPGCRGGSLEVLAGFASIGRIDIFARLSNSRGENLTNCYILRGRVWGALCWPAHMTALRELVEALHLEVELAGNFAEALGGVVVVDPGTGKV